MNRKEDKLQQAITAWLNNIDHYATREVPAGGGFVDIWTPQYLIEVKPSLTRSAQFQAAGQLGTYDNDYPDHIKVIAGVTPADAATAHATAERIRADGIEVWFMDTNDDFVEFCHGLETPATVEDAEEGGDIGVLIMTVLATFLTLFVASYCSRQIHSPQPSPPPQHLSR